MLMAVSIRWMGQQRIFTLVSRKERGESQGEESRSLTASLLTPLSHYFCHFIQVLKFPPS